MAHMSSFLKPYKHKALASDQIRILYLAPGLINDDDVSVQISHEWLKASDLPNSYKALSWKWGAEEETAIITIRNKPTTEDPGMELYSLYVKPTLLEALKHIRRQDSIVRIWIDAICIRQDEGKNNDEKSEQIANMIKIFGLADEVWVWLGVERNCSKEAMEFINTLINLDDAHHIAGWERSTFNESHASDLKAFVDLLKRGWFSRRWVVQEIAMARKAMVFCGAQKIEWHKLADAVVLLEKFGRQGEINRIIRKLPTTSYTSDHVGNISSLPAYRLVQNTTGMFRRNDTRGIISWHYTLGELVSFLAAFKASRLHDTIYAVLGLASDVKPRAVTKSPATQRKRPLARRGTKFAAGEPDSEFEVNYETHPLVVYKKFVEQAIKASLSLDIICRPWAPRTGLDAKNKKLALQLPSWITPIDKKPFQPTREGNMVRFHPDPLVGATSFRHKLYRASGDTARPKFEIHEVDSSTESLLQLDGFNLGTIDELWDSGEFGNVPAAWLAGGGWETKEHVQPPPDELWRTLCADRDFSGNDPDRSYPLGFQSVAKERGIEHGFETNRIINECTNAAVGEIFRRVQAVVWKRRLVRIEGGFMTWLEANFEKKGGQGVEADTSVSKRSHTADGAAGGTSTDPPEDAENVEPDGTDAAEPGQVDHQPKPPQPSNDQQQAKSAPRALGLAPQTAQKGDLVCIIYGCSVPLVLRQHANDRYTLVGEAYVDHMMDGEAIAWREEDEKVEDVTYFVE